MKAVVFREHGGPEKLEYVQEFPKPELSENEVLIRVRATALNHLDIWVRQGLPGLKLPLPHISGCDASGEIAALGPGVTGWSIGQAVAINPGISCFECDFCREGRDNLCVTYKILGEHVHGGLAEYVKVKKGQLAAKPSNLSFEETAAYPLTFMTAWHMLMSHGALRGGQSVLILGASSGLGTAAIQIAKLAGASPIIAAASNQEKLDNAQNLGADILILMNKENTTPFHRDVLKATQSQGVDIVFEHIGPATMPNSIKCVKKGGMIVTCGATTGPQAPVDLRYFYSKEIRLQGSIMGTQSEFQKITALMGKGLLRPIIDSVWPLQQARLAQEKMLSRQFFGKIVLTPNGA